MAGQVPAITFWEVVALPVLQAFVILSPLLVMAGLDPTIRDFDAIARQSQDA
jgi:hypothetical protein